MALQKDTIQKPFWALEAGEVLSLLESDHGGLREDEAARRQKIFGPNTLPEQKRLRRLAILARQFKSPLIFILIVAGLITLFLKEWGDTLIIFSAVAINAFLGFYQEQKAENTLALLKTYIKERIRVLRAGHEKEMDAKELVPGDIIRVSQGDRVPADARLIFVNDLQIDESILTGESLPVIKSTTAVLPSSELGDRTSMVWSGTSVVQGFADAVVTATDNSTELGKIALLVRRTPTEETPLQKALLRFTIRVSVILGVLVSGLFAIGVYVGKPVYEMFLIAVATAVSAVPEGLPIALTVILAIGVQRLAARKGIVRKLLAAETLGSTTVILTDKTGTLTEAKMKLKNILPFGEPHEAMAAEKQILNYALLNTDVILENPEESPEEWRISGRALETALVRDAVRFGVVLPQVKKEVEVLDRLPFNSTNKFSASLIKKNGKYFIAFLGAPDILIKKSKLERKKEKELLEKIDTLAYTGERVLGIAIREVKDAKGLILREEAKRECNPIGLISFRDPVRKGIKEVIERIGARGVKTIILTGDHRGTAEAVAKELGISADAMSVADGAAIDALSDKELVGKLGSFSVIARVTPEQKLRIAMLYKQKGEVVAMTGDGVNDAPALKEANIGVAVGSGSDVAKAVADLVILDDNFETIVAAIVEGRRMLQNIRKVIIYLLSNSFDELALIGGALLMGLALPLNALQILWVNMFSDSFPAMALAFESDAEDAGSAPVDLRERLFDKEMKFFILVIGVLTSILLFALYVVFVAFQFDLRLVQTFIFASFGTYTLFLIFSVRSLRVSIFARNPFKNHFLVGGVLIGFVLMALAIYLPPLQRLLDTVPLPLVWMLGVVGVGIFNICAIETGKFLFRKRIIV